MIQIIGAGDAVILVALGLSALAFVSSLGAQPNQGDQLPMEGMHGQGGGIPLQGMHGGMPLAGQHPRAVGRMPVMVGEDAFGAIQEIVRILEADPDTDWSKLDLAGLRQHLIDMNEVTLHADAVPNPVEGGIAV